MKALLASLLLIAGLLGFPDSRAAEPAAAAPLVVHEWGTFTSFSGSDGVPIHFTPNYTDLPEFVYSQSAPQESKSGRLDRDGTVSMETPVIYFYSDREMKASVKVSFPRGWITEWYPFASTAPTPAALKTPGQSMQWDVRLLAGQSVTFPGNPANSREDNRYFVARETDAVPLQAEVAKTDRDRNYDLRGGAIVQREKFLFYRGVGTFPPPVTIKASSGGNVKIVNAAGGKLEGLVLVHVNNGKVGFKRIGSLDTKGETTASIPAAEGNKAELASAMVEQLTAAGLYEKEAKAMVSTWDSAWFGEPGLRLLYIVPRSKTDELLPLSITPKPTAVVRVLVGRHDFLTPEEESAAEASVIRSRDARTALESAEAELRKIGRFSFQARQQAEKRLDASGARR